MSSNASERDVARRMGFGRPRPKLQASPSETRADAEKSFFDALGVRPGMKVALVGVSDSHLRSSASHSGAGASSLIPLRPVDVIVYQAESIFSLRRVRELVPLVKHGGALWVLWPKGQPHITESHVQRSGLSAGMMDVAAVGVTDRLAGLKFVHKRRER